MYRCTCPSTAPYKRIGSVEAGRSQVRCLAPRAVTLRMSPHHYSAPARPPPGEQRSDFGPVLLPDTGLLGSSMMGLHLSESIPHWDLFIYF